MYLLYVVVFVIYVMETRQQRKQVSGGPSSSAGEGEGASAEGQISPAPEGQTCTPAAPENGTSASLPPGQHSREQQSGEKSYSLQEDMVASEGTNKISSERKTAKAKAKKKSKRRRILSSDEEDSEPEERVRERSDTLEPGEIRPGQEENSSDEEVYVREHQRGKYRKLAVADVAASLKYINDVRAGQGVRAAPKRVPGVSPERVTEIPPAEGTNNKLVGEIGNMFQGALKEVCSVFGKELKESIRQLVPAQPPQEEVAVYSVRSDVRSRSRGQRRRSRRSVVTHPPSTTSDEDSDGHEEPVAHEVGDQNPVRRSSYAKLPAFNGKELWKIWFARFEAVAKRNRWSDGEKLDELLPRLQGPAGEFVYGQLTDACRGRYPDLVKELNARFRVVETAKTFGAQFSNRTQKSGETPEEFAAELKRLYDKAHVRRDAETRKEDLLRKFLDGLNDDRVRFHVEYVKEPSDIDEAVYYVVHFQETKRRPLRGDDGSRRPVRKIEALEADYSSDFEIGDLEENVVARLPSKAVKSSNPRPKDDAKTKEITPANQAATITEELKKMCAEMVLNEMKKVNQPNAKPSTPRQFDGRRRSYRCYHCQDPSHMIKDCPARIAGLPPTPYKNNGEQSTKQLN